MSCTEASLGMLEKQLISQGEPGQKIQEKCLAGTSAVTPIKACCVLLLIILLVSVVALSVALAVSLTSRKEEAIQSHLYAACPTGWIGFGSKCFYFSEDTRNWTFSQTSCLSLEAQLARFESLEELNFLSRYKGPSDHWIGLRRASAQHAWRWTDNTEYNNMAFIRGAGECAYLNDKGISSARIYTERKWICSKPNSYSLQCLLDKVWKHE